tara:strand:- start:133 stop:348 length:216 start_codon:yes stop_codon:yes gene_type:complete
MMKINIQIDPEDRLMNKAGALCTLSITKVTDKKKNLLLKMQVPIWVLCTLHSEPEREEEIQNKKRMIWINL